SVVPYSVYDRVRHHTPVFLMPSHHSRLCRGEKPSPCDGKSPQAPPNTSPRTAAPAEPATSPLPQRIGVARGSRSVARVGRPMADTISFARGAPSADILPHEQVREAAQRALTDDWETALSYGVGIGHPGLCEWIAERHGGVDPAQVMVTNGSLEA